ncbi:MAG: hypothetical protein PHF46_04685 [Candidatus Gracilibacteria bacterium]|nr:hypothetical protein [Candidatus Gracilibacteria bacterium]
MNITITFSGPAGSGVNTSGLLLGELLAHKGYNVIGDKEYASIIKGNNNIFILYISKDEHYISSKLDFFFAFDEFGIEKNSKVYELGEIYRVFEQKPKYLNTFSYAAACKLLGISKEEGLALLKEKIHKADAMEQNEIDFNAGYNYINESRFDFSKNIGTLKKFLFGNEIIAKGASVSELEFYAAYPMTPASSIIEAVLEEPKVTFFQGEDEIAVAMAMLGAKFNGKRSMCGTSGGGFALMTESLSFSYIAELGGVYILSQRAGPSTGTPTFTEQADILFCMNCVFGDVKPIVILGDDFEGTYNLIGKALNWSDMYQYPVIFVVDKRFSESYVAVSESDLKGEPVNRGALETNPKEDFVRFAYTENGISKYTIPGTKNGEFITTSYEHDEYGVSTEDVQTKIKMTEKRAKKLETFIKTEFNKDFYGYDIINPEAKKFFVTFGFNKYVLKDWVKKNPEYGLIVIKVIQPLDFRLKEFLDKNENKIEKLIFVEMNYSGQLEEVIVKNFALNNNSRKSKIKNIRKYGLYPIFEEDVTEKLKEFRA